ncbi:MAG: hypothetical protein AB1411_15695 [Nitrospirota bacterium]
MATTKPAKRAKKTSTDLLIRHIDNTIYAELRVAAALHGMYMAEYVLTLITQHLRELKRRGVKLTIADYPDVKQGDD